MKKLKKAGLYWRTLRHLKAIQITNRIKRKLFPVKINNSTALSLRGLSVDSFYAIPRSKSILWTDTFLFLNKKEKLTFPSGWNDQSLSKLWLYNLHYFEGLMNKKTTVELKQQLIEQWIAENPIEHGNGWEPYPISLRITNWIKWALSGNTLSQNALHSLAVQTRYLMKTIEFHLLGNHLFANAKALVFAGIFFKGPEPERWLSRGLKILEEQIPEQFLDDGGHFELSTTYQALLVEDLLDILYLLQVGERGIPEEWKYKAKKAVEWLVIMTRPDGLPPLFNDSAYGITPSLQDITSLSSSVGLEVAKNFPDGLTDLPNSGYFRYETGKYAFFGDAGQVGPDYIPGHAHCDMANYELFAADQPIIVDTGVSTYENSARRHLERSTVSHNTVQIAGEEQSEIWGAFRIGRRAKIKKRVVIGDKATVSYVGYGHSRYEHQRTFSFEPSKILISDEIFCKRLMAGASISRIHFHPNVDVEVRENTVQAGPLLIRFEGAKRIDLTRYCYAPEFNTLVSAHVIEIAFDTNLETTITL
ncbi:heparinase II/III family protein [Paremcibacter congregatus]|uniref:Heparinase n=1 Tax=Paremcibacter congregatus TaxID=2043170 RepID=A0A2G4YRC7_9PROT|nr:alginate lyase family protein [Paremcibacter congregatus]PHZ84837.1 heparinase [Paremcibacter congregatus]QDE26190.1 heparinase [Paremcibacter congregatus]